MADTTTTGPRTSARAPLHHRSSVPRLVQPVVAKYGSVFLLCSDTGDVLPRSDQGLYFHDMRYLSAQTLRLDGEPLVPLLADTGDGHRLLFALTNLDLRDAAGRVRIPKETLAIRRERTLGASVTEVLAIHNYGHQPVAFTVQVHYAADFADMFVVRGMHPGTRGTLHAPVWRDAVLTFRYDGADQHTRTTALHFSAVPDTARDGSLGYHVRLQPQQEWTLTVECHLRHDGPRRIEPVPDQTVAAPPQQHAQARQGALGSGTEVETSNQLFNAILARSFLDLHMLAMREQGREFFAAGVPWYVALFGRDSLITSIQTVAFQPEVSANTLRVLASYQGTRVDDWRDEQPGKILHELRVDELANLDEIPQTPYYGSVDSTLLFLVVLGIYARWTGSLDLFCELRDNVRAALDWITQYGDSDHDGFIDYQTHSPSGSRNQGWKDAGNAIVMEDGALAVPPIALPEVQGDTYLAWQLMAELFERQGDAATASALRQKAQHLYAALNEQFWLPDVQYYALCRQADGRCSRAIASNAAHALWTGIIDPRHAAAVIERVLQPDMFSGWGIRTLSAQAAAYNPVEYQLGSIWPHDNAMIVAGMHRYGFSTEANQVFTASMDAAMHFDQLRLPEVFAGYDRSLASRPVRYPVACNPQAWAAGSIPFMLTSVLGLEPDAFDQRLRIRNPALPDWLEWVRLRRLRVGAAEVDLDYQRTGQHTFAAVSRKQGELVVTIET